MSDPVYTAQQVSKTVEENTLIYTFCVYKDDVVHMVAGNPHQFTFGVPQDAHVVSRVTNYVHRYLQKLCGCQTPDLENAPDFDTIDLPPEE